VGSEMCIRDSVIPVPRLREESKCSFEFPASNFDFQFSEFHSIPDYS